QLGIEQQDLPGDLFPRRERGILLANPEIAAQILEQREERNRFSVSHCMSLVDGDSLRAAALGELVTEAALAYAWVSDDSHDLRIARHRPAECGLEASRLLVTAHET